MMPKSKFSKWSVVTDIIFLENIIISEVSCGNHSSVNEIEINGKLTFFWEQPNEWIGSITVAINKIMQSESCYQKMMCISDPQTYVVVLFTFCLFIEWFHVRSIDDSRVNLISNGKENCPESIHLQVSNIRIRCGEDCASWIL